MRGRGAAVLVACAAVLLAACDARVGPYLGATGGLSSGNAGTAVGRAGHVGRFGQASSATTLAPGGSSGSSGPSSPASPASAAAARTETASQASFNFNPAVEAAACTGTAGNRSSDVGVTPTSITLGNVSGLTGPLTNNFNQGPEGVQAALAAVDAYGGICGRKLQLDVEDDGQDASRNASDIADLIPKSFAFVGSTSDADSGGVPEMVQAGIPDIGFAINTSRALSPVYWSPGGGSIEQINGAPYIYDTLFAGMKARGTFPSRMAFLAYSIPISATAAHWFAHVYQEDGGTICYTDYSVSPATASLSGDVLEMRNSSCQGVFTTMDVTGNAKLLQSMQQQDFHPAYAGTPFDSYTPAQITAAGESAAQGFQIYLNFVPLSDPNPTMQLYEKELAAYEPGKQPSGFGLLAWASAQMLIYGLIHIGHNPTRAALVKVFDSLTNWSTGGTIGPVTPSAHSVENCTVDVQVRGNTFVRLWPSQGLYCGGRLVPAQ